MSLDVPGIPKFKPLIISWFMNEISQFNLIKKSYSTRKTRVHTSKHIYGSETSENKIFYYFFLNPFFQKRSTNLTLKELFLPLAWINF